MSFLDKFRGKNKNKENIPVEDIDTSGMDKGQKFIVDAFSKLNVEDIICSPEELVKTNLSVSESGGGNKYSQLGRFLRLGGFINLEEALKSDFYKNFLKPVNYSVANVLENKYTKAEKLATEYKSSDNSPKNKISHNLDTLNFAGIGKVLLTADFFEFLKKIEGTGINIEKILEYRLEDKQGFTEDFKKALNHFEDSSIQRILVSKLKKIDIESVLSFIEDFKGKNKFVLDCLVEKDQFDDKHISEVMTKLLAKEHYSLIAEMGSRLNDVQERVNTSPSSAKDSSNLAGDLKIFAGLLKRKDIIGIQRYWGGESLLSLLGVDEIKES